MIHPRYTYDDWSNCYKAEMVARDASRSTTKYLHKCLPFQWAIRKEWKEAQQKYFDAQQKTMTTLNYLMWLERNHKLTYENALYFVKPIKLLEDKP